MIGRTTVIHEPYAPWSARASLFALALVLAAMLLHRISWATTPTALNLMGAGFMLAALGFALGLIAATSIWIRGRTGAWSTAWGLMIAAALWMWPAALAPTYMRLPKISDISTDTASPPAFAVLSKQRGPGSNSAAYGGTRVAQQQTRAYPDLHTLIIPRSAEEVFEVALDLMRGRRGLGWKVVAEVAPDPRLRKPGVIEATDKTMILGFTDDIVIRVGGTDAEARVDIRSASRYGSHDMGTNAGRIRRFVRELSTRLEATGPVGVASRGGARLNQANVPAGAVGPGVRRPIERTPEKGGERAGERTSQKR